jgi:hypothetical protein
MDGIVIVLSEPGRRLMFGLTESQFQTTATEAVATLLQTRTPTGKWLGPEAGLLLSSPITFQVMGPTFSVALAGAAARSRKPMAATAAEQIFRGLDREALERLDSVRSVGTQVLF